MGGKESKPCVIENMKQINELGAESGFMRFTRTHEKRWRVFAYGNSRKMCNTYCVL